MLEYAELSEFADVVDILKRSDHENTYQDLMNKEDKVLDTVNKVVKEYRDKNIKESEFINRPLVENASRFWLDMNLMAKELFDVKEVSDIKKVLTKGERVIYLGILVIAAAVIFFFVDISS